MSEIPEITFNEFHTLKAGQIREMKSVIVTADGERLFTAVIVPQNVGMAITDDINIRAEYLGARANTVGGKHPDEVMAVGGQPSADSRQDLLKADR